MKRIFLTAILVLATLSQSILAQNPTTYFMEGSTFRTKWNPAFAPQRGYINIPVLGGIELGTNGNIALNNLLFARDGKLNTIFSSSVPTSLALSDLSQTNRLGVSSTINLIGFGAYSPNQKNFWSVAINLRTNADTQLPYSFFDFMKTGIAQDISGIGVHADCYAEATFTHSFPLARNLYFGFSGKFLMGIARGRFYFDQFDAQMDAECWSANAVGLMEFSGFNVPTSTTDDGILRYEKIGESSLSRKPVGYGFGIDLGITYDILPELQLSASINDIGCMFWSKKHNSMGVINKSINFTGVEVSPNGNANRPRLNLNELLFEVADNKAITEMLTSSLNLGGEYNFLDRRIGLGVFYNVAFWEYKTRHNLTASANFRPLRWLHASGSYSILDNEASAVGLALNICPGWINLFVGTDILLSKKTPQWIPISQNNFNITFGLGIPVGRCGTRHYM